MVARIAPEPITIGITFAPDFKRSANRSTRPVENASPATPDPHQNGRRSGTAGGGDTPQPSARPPGKDPSIPPQALIDASLIAAEFKPDLKLGIPDPAEQPDPEAADTGTAPAEETRGTASRNVPEPTALVLMKDALEKNADAESGRETETPSESSAAETQAPPSLRTP